MFITLLQSCYFFNFFDKEDQEAESQESIISGVVQGQTLGNKAGEASEEALNEIHAITTDIAPAAIRIDPDIYARKLLLQYHKEGTTIAKQIGKIENYRSLLGGASEDFQTKPQEEFDATSLLTTMTVATIVCEGLVNPNSWEHAGWKSILPATPDQWEKNIRYLAQRFIGKPSNSIDSTIITELKNILDTQDNEGGYSNGSYVSVCATLALDADALFL